MLYGMSVDTNINATVMNPDCNKTKHTDSNNTVKCLISYLAGKISLSTV